MTPQEFLQKAERIHANIQEETKNKPSFKHHIPNPLKISLKEAQSRYPDISFKRLVEALDGDNKKILVFEGDVVSQYTYDDDWLINTNLAHLHTYDDEIYGKVVIGNLIIDGDIYSQEYDNLLVTGDVVCDCLFSWRADMEVSGNLVAYQGIYAQDFGEIKVKGTTKTPYAINGRSGHWHQDEFYLMPHIYAEEYLIIWRDVHNGGMYAGTLNGKKFQKCFDVSKMFRSEKIYDNNYFQDKMFFQMIKNGENPFLTWQEFEKTM